MASPQYISKATATRRERKLQRMLRDTEAIVAVRNAVVKHCEHQIDDLTVERQKRGDQLAYLAKRLVDYAGDLKIVADVLNAYGAEDAEARLRTIAGNCEQHHRRIIEILGQPVDGCTTVARTAGERA